MKTLRFMFYFEIVNLNVLLKYEFYTVCVLPIQHILKYLKKWMPYGIVIAVVVILKLSPQTSIKYYETDFW